MLCIYWCDTALTSQLAVYEFTLKTKPCDLTPSIMSVLIKDNTSCKRNWMTGLYMQKYGTGRGGYVSSPFCRSGVMLTFLIHSLWNYRRTCLHQLCVLLTLLHSLAEFIVLFDQIFRKKVVEGFEGLDNVDIRVQY